MKNITSAVNNKAYFEILKILNWLRCSGEHKTKVITARLRDQ